MSRLIRPAAVLGLLAAMCGTVVTAAELVPPDRIFLVSNQEVGSIKITEATSSSVTYVPYSGPGPGVTLPREVIKEIRWGDAPPALQRAIASLSEQGNARAALSAIEGLPETGPRAFWYKPFRGLFYAQCLMALTPGKYAEALPELQNVIRDYPNSFYVLDAIQTKMAAHKALQQYEEVAKTAEALDPDAPNPQGRAPYGKLWQLRGRLAMAEALVLSKQQAKATALYEGLDTMTKNLLADPPESMQPAVSEISAIQQQAWIGQCQALKSSDPAKAAAKMEEVKEQIKDEGVRLDMYMTLGDLYQALAEKQNTDDAKRVEYKKALFVYMRIYILYPEYKEVRPKAMLNAASASGFLGTPDDKTRAIRIAKELVAEFPESPEAKEAGRLLESLGVKTQRNDSPVE